MTLKQCYKGFGRGLQRYVSPAVQRTDGAGIPASFLEDQSYEQLWRSFENHDYRSAFQAAHILKRERPGSGALEALFLSEALAEALQNGGKP